MRVRERVLSRTAAFWLLACLLTSFLFAASAPSPLYSVFQAMWRFPASTLTLIYAVYAFEALAASLITGCLSGRLPRWRKGRRWLRYGPSRGHRPSMETSGDRWEASPNHLLSERVVNPHRLFRSI